MQKPTWLTERGPGGSSSPRLIKGAPNTEKAGLVDQNAALRFARLIGQARASLARGDCPALRAPGYTGLRQLSDWAGTGPYCRRYPSIRSGFPSLGRGQVSCSGRSTSTPWTSRPPRPSLGVLFGYHVRSEMTLLAGARSG